MRTGRNRPGASTDFIDSANNEVLLRVGCDAEGTPLVAFRLYDCQGELVAETEGFCFFPAGVKVVAGEEVLLFIPEDPGDDISYRIYNRDGRLITCSDGHRTEVLAFLRMEKGRMEAGRGQKQQP